LANTVITIGRQYGSGGKTIGHILARRLQINCYDREIIAMASEKSGINEELFGSADEKLKSSLLFKTAKKIYKGELLSPESDEFVSNANLFNYQAKIIKELAAQESCVIIGRAADYILRDNTDIISVFVHASKEFCLKSALERHTMSSKEMEKFIEKTDKYRADYYQYYTGQKWNDARNYDLCLNSEKLGFDKCVDAILAYIEVRKK
jgi:Cytidylate kinase